MPLTTAAAIPEVFLTAYQALFHLARLSAKEKVLIHAGASGVGTAAIQLARKVKAQIIVTASKNKHPLCLTLGAHHSIDYKSEDFLPQVKSLTQQQGVNVIIDFIGKPNFNRNLSALSVDGRMVLLALMGGQQVDAVQLGTILTKRLHIIGSTLRARSIAYKADLMHNFKEFAWSDFEQKKLFPVIDSVYPWRDIVKAHQRMESNANAGKIVVTITE